MLLLRSAILLLSFVLVTSTTPKREGEARGGNGVGASVTRPNFLILFPDQWRSNWAGSFYGMKSLKMPVFESLANSGTRFSNAFVPSPLCAPSRACLASGREYDEAGVPDNFSNDFPLSIATFYQLLEQSGYHTMVSGKDDLTKASGPGLDGQYHARELGFSDFARTEGKEDVLKSHQPTDPYGLFCLNHTTDGNLTLWDILLNKDSDCCSSAKGASSGYYCDTPTLMPQFGYEDDFVTNRSIDLLDKKPSQAPWLLHVSFPGPHPPFIVTQSMKISTLNDSYPFPIDNTVLSKQDALDISRLYAAELEHLDSLFGIILQKLKDIGEYENTIIFVATDHGEMLGDHSDWGKTLPWQGSISVPLVVVAPSLGVKQQIISDHPVATMDIAGTILDFAGISPSINMTTQSFKKLLLGDTVASYPRPYVSSGLALWRAVMMADQNGNESRLWKLICCKGPCPGSPSTLTDGIAEGFIDHEWQRTVGLKMQRHTLPTSESASDNGDQSTASNTILLYDVLTDSGDMVNLADKFPDVVLKLKGLVPSGYC